MEQMKRRKFALNNKTTNGKGGGVRSDNYGMTHHTFRTALYVTVSGLTFLFPPLTYASIMRSNSLSALSPASTPHVSSPPPFAYDVSNVV